MSYEQAQSLSDQAQTQGGAGAGRILRLILTALVIAAVIILGRVAGTHLERFIEWVGTLGMWGPMVFMLGYAGAVVAFAPGSVLSLAAGAVFGLAQGVTYVLVAATLGASAAFLAARYFVRGAVERKLEGNERFAVIDRAVGREGRKIVLLLRLSPIFPFNLLNYALGLTRVRFSDYFVASAGMLPGTLLYVYLGKVAAAAAVAAGGSAAEAQVGGWPLTLGGLVVTAIVTVWVTRIARRALRTETGT